MSSIARSTPRSDSHPATVTWAIVLTIVGNLASFAVVLLPGADEIPAGAIVIGVAASLISIALCWPLWRGKRWAALTLTVITVLNTLTSLPGLLEPPSGAIVGVIVVGIAFTAAICWLLWHPDSRATYR